jgi:hypothetical protein
MDDFKREIAGALRSTIDAHGPITADEISSATKRVAGMIREQLKRERDVILQTSGRTRPPMPPQVQSILDRTENSSDPEVQELRRLLTLAYSGEDSRD